jgi:phage regulator Rha-like protein
MDTSVERLEYLIHEVRGHKVILDSDLARLYGVPTKRLNEQVKRNHARFPKDFMFQLTRDEFQAARNRSQIATSKRGGRRYLPYVFTEHGALMAANVLNSPRAVQMSIFLVRAFVKMRGLLADTRQLAHKLVALEQELKGRLDLHDAAIITILQRVMDLIDPPSPPPEPPKKSIGFYAKDGKGRYRVAKRWLIPHDATQSANGV